MTSLARWRANLFEGWFQLRHCFPTDVLEALTQAITRGEAIHRGEVRFAIESRLPGRALVDGMDARARAGKVFGDLRVWDTEHNNGVLLYVLLAERRIEVIADRGIAGVVEQTEWDALCARMREAYARGEWREGSLAGIAATDALLARHFPSDGSPRHNELPDRPVVI